MKPKKFGGGGRRDNQNGRPALSDEGRSRAIQIRLPPTLVDAIDETAGERGVSRNAVIYDVIRRNKNLSERRTKWRKN